jgi:hypothetical protein
MLGCENKQHIVQMKRTDIPNRLAVARCQLSWPPFKHLDVMDVPVPINMALDQQGFLGRVSDLMPDPAMPLES